MRSPLVSTILALAWLALSFYLLTLPGTELPTINWFDEIHGDKFVHIGMFGTLVLLWILPFRKAGPKKIVGIALLIAVIALGYGIAMEFVQRCCVIHRSFDVGDIIADGVGSFLPVLFAKRLVAKTMVSS